MKAGEVLREFVSQDGRKVVLRTPRWEDLDDFIDFINSLVEEKAQILKEEKVTREEEAEWLSRVLASMEKEEAYYVVAEVDGRVVGNSEISKRRLKSMSHAAWLGIAIRQGFRDVGIGTEMMKSLIQKAKSWGIRQLYLTVFSTNTRARHFYKRLGFKDTGTLPKSILRDGEYIDQISMALELK